MMMITISSFQNLPNPNRHPSDQAASIPILTKGALECALWYLLEFHDFIIHPFPIGIGYRTLSYRILGYRILDYRTLRLIDVYALPCHPTDWADDPGGVSGF